MDPRQFICAASVEPDVCGAQCVSNPMCVEPYACGALSSCLRQVTPPCKASTLCGDARRLERLSLGDFRRVGPIQLIFAMPLPCGSRRARPIWREQVKHFFGGFIVYDDSSSSEDSQVLFQSLMRDPCEWCANIDWLVGRSVGWLVGVGWSVGWLVG